MNLYRLLCLSLLLALSINSQALANDDQLTIGRSFFHIPWVAAPSSTTARDGLGPLFNANTCVTCHATKLKAFPSNHYEASFPPFRSLVIKLSQGKKPVDPKQITTIDPVYGGQIATHAIPSILPEAKPVLSAEEIPFYFSNNDVLLLRRWQIDLKEKNYGDLSTDTRLSPRLAPVLMGLSLIESIPTAHLIKQQQTQQKLTPHLAGELNWVYSPETQQMEIGRFGWKASQASLLTQTADAAYHDMGLSSPLFPEENCTPSQLTCQQAPKGRVLNEDEKTDLTSTRLEAIRAYTAQLPLPPALTFDKPLEARIKRGEMLFNTMQCGVCHQARQETATGKAFFPYSDFLLHDLGQELADHRPEFQARTQQWRTAPLWRNRYKTHFLHDGRARSLLEAIAWHGGQALPSQQAFRELSPSERQDLILFLESL